MLTVFKNLSLRNRAALAAALTLFFFFSLAGFGLLRAYEDSLNNAAEGELRAYMLSLLGAIDVDDKGVLSLEDLPVAAFNQPNSGVYAEIWQQKRLLWRSNSLIGQSLPSVESKLGQYQFYSSITDNFLSNKAQAKASATKKSIATDSKETIFKTTGLSQSNNILSLKIDWNDGVLSEQFDLVVANDAEPFFRRQQGYKKNLLLWLLGLGFGLVFLQVLLFRWLFKPINKVIDELKSIQAGEQRQFSSEYPSEVGRLTQSLNVFLDNEGRHIKRVKESLANLAHSLKTPLAVIQSELTGESGKDSSCNKVDQTALLNQVDRISTVINYQLNRTSTSVRPSYRQATSCYDDVERLIAVMQRLHESKGILITREITKNIVFKGDVDDLSEILGNILENACKWADSKIQINVFNDSVKKLHISVVDDGPGIPLSKIDDVLQRGRRLDVHAEGQGIGLSMVNDIVESYSGEISLLAATEINFEFTSGLAVLIKI